MVYLISLNGVNILTPQPVVWYTINMDNLESFENWLNEKTTFTNRTKSNIKSRVKRANLILPFENSDVYIFHLANAMKEKGLSVSVRSQIKKSVMLYVEFLNEGEK